MSPLHGGADRNVPPPPSVTTGAGRPFTGARIETGRTAHRSGTCRRRPFTGARIETANACARCRPAAGRPFTGARIETFIGGQHEPDAGVAPSRGRGSKLLAPAGKAPGSTSPLHGGADRNVADAVSMALSARRPFTGARIETAKPVLLARSSTSRPFTGARIETR